MRDNISAFAFANVIEIIKRAEKLQELSSFILLLPSLYGVQQIAYCAFQIGGGPPWDPIIALHTFSPDWTVLYGEQNYVEIDPVLAALHRSALPLDWDSVDRDTARARHFFAEAKRHGIGGKGCTIPIENRYGDRALFTFTADLPDEDWPRFRRAREAELAFLGWHLHERAMTLCGYRDTRALPSLSAQERRCLEHLIQAQSPKAIARTMDLSVSTVRMHLNNARLKLGCKTLPQAVAVAVRRGLVAI